MSNNRVVISSLALSAAAFIALVSSEGYTDKAIIPVPGDVPTIGFGTTGGVKIGDTITAPKALARALSDVQKFEGAVRECVTVPLHQYEYDAYINLSYNIGTGAFCRSTLVQRLNAFDYQGACEQILRWDKFNGKPLRGLTIRRKSEYLECLGGA
jgi:lysozyme